MWVQIIRRCGSTSSIRIPARLVGMINLFCYIIEFMAKSILEAFYDIDWTSILVAFPPVLSAVFLEKPSFSKKLP